MRRVWIVICATIVVMTSVFLEGCTCSKKMIDFFDTLVKETTEEIPYVYNDTLVLEGTSLNFSELLQKNGVDGTFREVYVVQDDIVFFCYSTNGDGQNGGDIWHIATASIDDQVVESIYSEEFCFDSAADRHYILNNNDHSINRYETANGFYHNNKVVLTDHVKLIEFDLTAKKAVVFKATEYRYPSMPNVQIVDYETIVFSQGSRQQTFSINRAKETSKAFEKILELEENENWQGKSLLSNLFDKVEVVNGKIYIICRIMNWNGETHAAVFEYDFETNSCQYAFHCFTNDLITENLYVVNNT